MALEDYPQGLSNLGEDIHAELGKRLIDEYLKARGYTRESLARLAAAESQRIMNEASTYASCKLAEIENKARFTQNLQETA